MARTKATAHGPDPSRGGFLPPRLAVLEAARAVLPTSSAAAPAVNALAPVAAQEPAAAVNAPAPVAAQDSPPPFNAEEMRSFLAQMETMNSSGTAPMTIEQALAFTRQFRRFNRTITLAFANNMTQASQADTHSAAGGAPLITHAERQELRKKRIEAKQKMKDATTFYESTMRALHKHKTLVQEAQDSVDEKRERLYDAEYDYKVKRARLDSVQSELEQANNDLKVAKDAYETTKAQTERQ